MNKIWIWVGVCRTNVGCFRIAIAFVLLLRMANLGAIASGQVAGVSGADDLVIAQGGASSAIVAVSPKAGEWEKRAANDLVHYIELLSGARAQLANTDK